MASATTYNPLLKLTHWVMALIILGLIASGWYMEGLPREAENKFVFYGWHKSFGVLALGLLAWRVFLRVTTKTPPLPAGIKKSEQHMSHLAHGLLYLGMLAVPVSGYLMSDFGGHAVKFFGILLPDFFPTDKEAGHLPHEIHEIAPYVLLAVIALHLLGALKHRFFEPAENDVLSRMLCAKKKDKATEAAEVASDKQEE